MKENVNRLNGKAPAPSGSPILIVPYMWIGDFVRCHTVVRLLKERFPHRPVDVLTTAMVAPLLDYMPGVRKGIVFDLPRKRLAWSLHRELADEPARRRLWRRADHAADLEVGARAGARRHPGAHRLSRRNAFRPASTTSAGREGAAAHGRPLRRAGVAQGRRAPRRMAAAAARGAGGGGAAVARANGARARRGRWRWSRRARSARRNDGADMRTSRATRRAGLFGLGDRRPGGEGLAAEIVAARRRGAAISPAPTCAMRSWRPQPPTS